MERLLAVLVVLSGLPFAQAFAQDSAQAGAVFFKKQCFACHVATEAKNKVGPHLAGIVGRPVASVDSYRYSKAMQGFGEGGKVWDEALLAEYLPKPRDLVKGTSMAYAGIRKPEDVANLIEYLKNPAAAE